MTKAEIIKKLRELEISFNPSDKKEVLEALLPTAENSVEGTIEVGTEEVTIEVPIEAPKEDDVVPVKEDVVASETTSVETTKIIEDNGAIVRKAIKFPLNVPEADKYTVVRKLSRETKDSYFCEVIDPRGNLLTMTVAKEYFV